MSGADDETMRELRAKAARIAANQKQITERSGPLYELAKDRSRIIQSAWRAAGSPRKVSMVRTRDGIRYGVQLNTGEFEWVTEDDWNAWVAWRDERERLRAELRKM